jgi:hypothetical protein
MEGELRQGKPFLENAGLHALLIAGLAVLLYLNTLVMGVDDAGRGVIARGAGGFQPLTAFSFRLTGESVFAHRFVNVYLYAAACVAFWWAILLCFRRKALAFFTGLIFTAHPVHAGVVASMAGRAWLLSAVFFGLGWAFYIIGRDRARKRGKSITAWPLAATLGSLLLAMLAHPASASLILVLGLTDYYRRRESARTLFKQTWRHYVPLIGVVIVVFALRLVIIGNIAGDAPSCADNPLAHCRPGIRLVTAVAILGRCLYILLNPVALAQDYAHSGVTPVEPFTLTGLLVIVSAAAVIALLVYAGKRWKLLGFGALFALAVVLPCSNIFWPTPAAMSERYLFLAAGGFALPVGALLDHLAHAGARKAAWTAVCALLVFWCFIIITHA